MAPLFTLREHIAMPPSQTAPDGPDTVHRDSGVHVLAIALSLSAASAAELRIPIGKLPTVKAAERAVSGYCGDDKDGKTVDRSQVPLTWDECDAISDAMATGTTKDNLTLLKAGDFSWTSSLAKLAIQKLPAERQAHLAAAVEAAAEEESEWYLSPSVGINLIQYDATNLATRLEFAPAVGFGVRFKPPNVKGLANGSLFAADVRLAITQSDETLDVQPGLAISFLDIIGFGYLPVIALPSNGTGKVAVSHVIGIGAQRGF